MRWRSFLICAFLPVVNLVPTRAGQATPLLPESAVSALAQELSGESAHRTVEQLTQYHRMRGSSGFGAAARHIRDRILEYDLESVKITRFPADGDVFYGTQRSRPAWEARFAELWELRQEQGEWTRVRRIASWQERPVTLAQDSLSGRVGRAQLVDVGSGLRPEEYRGLEVEGNLVLTSSQPGAAAELAVAFYGAAGIVSYAQNQKSAWWGMDEDLVRWGHLETFSEIETFAFMVSPRQARSWQGRIADGETIWLSADVEASRQPGHYEIATGVIEGSDPTLRDREIVFSCHLDHQRPGANDNASGCATILEVARTLSKLIREGKLERPARTLRFWWPPEIEGSLAILNGEAGYSDRVAAVIHLDMVGGGEATKAQLHVTRSPKSLPTFVNDVAEEFGRFVNRESAQFADDGVASYPLVAPEGSRQALGADFVDLTLGSDHQVYADGSFRVPVIYMNDWPDRYIHTHRDSSANIDPTKLLRASFIAAAAGYYLASMGTDNVPEVQDLLQREALRDTSVLLDRLADVEAAERPNLIRFHKDFWRSKFSSVARFGEISEAAGSRALSFLVALDGLLTPRQSEGAESLQEGEARIATIYSRKEKPKGPMSAFGYNYLQDHLKKRQMTSPKLLDYRGLWGSGSEYAYEALNLVDGQRTVSDIRDDLSAIYGPVPTALVRDYLRALQGIGVLAGQGR